MIEKQLKTKYAVICVLLIIATLVTYGQVKDHAFVNLDDIHYITDNAHIKNGLTYEGVKWSLTAVYASNWHPVTWLSHMLDVQLFGLKPGAHHLVNLFFHVINTLLLFMILNRMPGALWKSAFVAALFALHPLHVESVAWASERKDVLSAFFWMLTMGAYVYYTEKPDFKRYLATLAFFILGLMAKPMLVTLPFVLLLLDYWPLNRFQFQRAEKDDSQKSLNAGNTRQKKRKAEKPQHPWAVLLPLLKEKIPFIILSALSGVVTIYAQKEATLSLQALPFADRIGNAFFSYIKYIKKMLWPQDLAVFYPPLVVLPAWQILTAAVLLLGITLIMLWKGKRYPYGPVGWFWYLGTLVPVIGLVQAGEQSMADRYTYIPIIGLFITAAWGIPEPLKTWRHQKIFLAVSSCLLIFALMSVSYKQVSCWKDSITLFQHCLDVTHDNYVAHVNLGVELIRLGKTEEAIAHFRKALMIKPNDAEAHANLGNELLRQGKTEEAISHFTTALQFNPNMTSVYINYGAALATQGKFDEAIRYLNKAVELGPGVVNAHGMLASVLFMYGKHDQAADEFREVLRLNPEDKTAKAFLNRIVDKSKEP